MHAASGTRPVALVTGAARRIGAAIARELHAAGYDLVLHGHRSAGELDALCAELLAARARSAVTVRADLALTERLPALVEAAIAQYGRLDALVNNASAFYPTPLDAATPQAWNDLFAVNARAPFFLCQAAAPQLRATRGAIVNLADIHTRYPPPDSIPYAASKAALVAVTRGLAQALAPDVRVNAVAPGAILWPEAGKTEDEKAAALARVPLARTGTPQEIAGVVRWLLVDAAYVTGQVIAVDGGRSIAG